MSDQNLDPTPTELSDIAMLGNDPSPLARVIYHMANRQLAMSERLSATQSEVIKASGDIRRIKSALSERGIYVNGGGSPSSRSSEHLASIEDI